MRMAGVADASVKVVMPSKPSLQRPAPLLPLPAPTSDTHSDDVQATPDNNSGPKRKRRSTDDGSMTDEEGDMSKTSSYECRFCNMRFAKSQALGGHMNRHRQERETEQYQHAQQLVSSMAQQQMPRTWNTMAAELNDASGSGAAAQLRSSTQSVTTGAPNLSRADGSRSQLPPQISFNSTRGVPITTTSSPTIDPDSSPSASSYLPSNSSSNNLQHLQWNVDGFNATHHGTMPRAGSHPSISALNSMTSGMRDDFLSGVLQPRHDAVAFGGPAQFSSNLTVPMLTSRAALGSATPSSFQESLQVVSGPATGLQFGHDHQNIWMTDVLRQLACTSSPLNSTLMQGNMNSNVDVKPPANSEGGGRSSVSNPTFLMQCKNIVQFKQPQCSLPAPRPLGNAARGQYGHVMSPSSMFSGHLFNNGHAAPAFGSLPPGHDFHGLQKFETNLSGSMPGPYHSVSRPAMAQTSSGSAASGSFGVSGGHERGMYGHVKMQAGDEGYNQLSGNQAHQLGPGAGGVPQQNQLNTPSSVVHEVVAGNHCESMNITTVTESGEVSELSAPARYLSTDFSSGSPEWRNQTSPSAHANHASPPSQEYCSR